MNKRIIDILQAMGALDRALALDIEAQAVAAGQDVDRYLVEQDLVKPDLISKAYAEQLGLPFIESISEQMADVALLSKIQFNFLRQNMVMPLLINGQVTVVSSNPYELAAIDDVMLLTDRSAAQAVAAGSVIIDAINRFYPLEGTKEMLDNLDEETGVISTDLDMSQINDQDILSMVTQAPIVKLVNHILFQAVKREASDIHIEPYEKEVRVRYRVDGIMHQAFTPPKRVQSALVSRIKIMSNLNIAEKRKPQDGRIEIKVSDKAYDIRVSVLPVMYGECIVLRLLDKSKAFAELEQLGLTERNFAVVSHYINQPNGVIFVSGPTGSGKTTTLYSVLSRLNSPEVNIVTVENPVEYQMAGINQVQVYEKIGLTFAAALRSILRQDPDIIMIGETRDVETAQIAIQSALTGHLVLSTIHTNSAPATITRLIDMGIEPYLIASSLKVVIAQRLVRRLRPDCREAYRPEATALRALGLSEKAAAEITFYRAVKPQDGTDSPYRGRLPIFEVMPITESIARLVVEKADAGIIREQAMKEGMALLLQDGIEKIKAGLTTVEEVLSVANSDEFE
jgi:general secretion pathway protein E